MFRDALRKVVPGLKLPCVPQIGAYNDGDYKLATVLCAIEFIKEPHRLVPESAFETLMKRDIDEVEAMVVVYDAQAVRDFLVGSRQPYKVNVLWQPYLFPTIKYREERQVDVECCVLGMHGASICKDQDAAGQPLGADLRTHTQTVGVKDRIYMTLGPDSCALNVDPLLPVCWFWTCVVPPEGHREKGSRFALVTKHIILNETISMATADLRQAFAVLTPVSTETILAHLRELLLAVQKATKQISNVMARCESAFEGVPLDRISKGGRVFQGPREPHEVWEEQLQLLSRNVTEPGLRGAPVLAQMARLRVHQVLGRMLGGRSLSDEEAVEEGGRQWALGASMTDKAKAIHTGLLGFVSDLEKLSERQGEMLSAGGPI
jgi:hypothetical protein